MCVFTLHCVLQSLSCWSTTYALIVEPSYPIGFLFILRGPIILYGILEFARVVSIWKFGIWTPACCVGPAWPKVASNSSLGLLLARELANPLGWSFCHGWGALQLHRDTRAEELTSSGGVLKRNLAWFVLLPPKLGRFTRTACQDRDEAAQVQKQTAWS